MLLTLIFEYWQRDLKKSGSTQHLDETLSSQGVQEIVEPFIRKTLPEDLK
jgi:hypothetical protein